MADGKSLGGEVGWLETEGMPLGRWLGFIEILGPSLGIEEGLLETDGKPLGAVLGSADNEGW